MTMNLPDPDDILTDADNRDIVVSVLNALDNRTELLLRAHSLVEIAQNIMIGFQENAPEAPKYLGALLGITMRLADEAAPSTHTVIDEFREMVADAAKRG